MSEITTENENDVNTVHCQLQIIQQRISAVEIEDHDGEICRPLFYIMSVCNEQANIIPRNQSVDRSIHKVKLQISSQSTSKCMIYEPHPGTPSTNKMDSNADTYRLGTNFIVTDMEEIGNPMCTHTILHMNLCIMSQ